MPPLQQSEVDHAAGALGRALLEFVCARPIEEIAGSGAATAIVRQINGVLATVVGEAEDPKAMGEFLRYRLSEEVDGEVLALTLHKQAGGVVSLPETTDRLDGLVVRMAAECYSTLLLPPDPFWADFPAGRLSTNATSLLFRHHLAAEFQAGVVSDAELAKIFKNETDHTGRTTDMIYRSTGRGNSLQLWSLLELIMAGAWRARPADGATPVISHYCQLALDRWQLVRRLLTTKSQVSVPAWFAFAGVRLPGGPYTFGDLVLRQAGDQDGDRVPKSIRGQLQTTNPDGEVVAIDYAGDVVAEAQVPYLVRFRAESDDSLPEWPADLVKANRTAELTEQLRVSLLLAVRREQRVQIAPSWQSIDDPLDQYPSQGWSDPRQVVGLMPTILSEEEVGEWQTWFGYVASPGSERLAIAMNRIIRATAERRDPVDVLIDSVIAWENMFGSSQGEPTLRVTASLALLLRSDPTERLDLREKLGKIYTLRSKAVHGSSQPKQTEIALCYEALDFAIAALRRIFGDRPDLLTEKDGTGRSLKLILGQAPTTTTGPDA
ncbi:HEPN domain-containing protein [Modestobacter sp. VKM Ac-2977]|uniref:HEPN domain-containing protein n=1 Tax=Modestobacter sp. VKM Ac-2977 TaxID=3004131 RepID=UPI0022AA79E9|nr:HEPN domain-containing protein [Modestobacter sp. VKM Ac-2977]MCZ2820774.1 HEPN domain-containing protein [Modestobacter sp. VKM Ac-2977]